MYEIIYMELQTSRECTKIVATYKELEYILEEIIGSNFLTLISVKKV